MQGLEPPSDRDLKEINDTLDWHAGTLLPDGRVLGRLARVPGKRTKPEPIPDPRIVKLDARLGLRSKSILEVGCFEGIHTAGLLKFCDDVTAVDLRPQNVMKTMTRLSWHGLSAKVFQADVEKLDSRSGRFDVIFHFGVLYHLANPIEHLANLGQLCSHLYLDTHVARDEPNIRDIEVNSRRYRAADHAEGGWADPFSGRHARSLWLTQESLIDALSHAGFASIESIEERDERNGPRILLLASAKGATDQTP